MQSLENYMSHNKGNYISEVMEQVGPLQWCAVCILGTFTVDSY